MQIDREVGVGKAADRTFLAGALRDFQVVEHELFDTEMRKLFPQIFGSDDAGLVCKKER